METYSRKTWITAAEAAELAGVTLGRIYQLGREGVVERRRPFGAWVYHRPSVARWAKQPQTTGRPRSRQ